MAEQSTAPASFAEGELSRHVLRLSGVMILSFLSITLAQLVEAVYLGLVGTQAIAAVTFTFPVMMAIFAATRGIGIGCGAILARAMGDKAVVLPELTELGYEIVHLDAEGMPVKPVEGEET